MSPAHSVDVPRDPSVLGAAGRRRSPLPWVLGGVLVLGLLVAAGLVLLLGGDDERAETIGTTVPPPGGAVTTGGQPSGTQATSRRSASSYLLTVADMPTGYSQAPSTTSTTTAPNQQDVATPAECGETPADQKIPGDAAEAQFQGSSLFNVVFQFVGVTDEKNAKTSFDLIRSYAQRCASYTERDGETGEQRQYTTSALSFPKLGDETFAMRISGGPSSFNIGIDIVVIRRGGVLTVVGGVGADGPVLEQIARKAAAKL